MRFSNLLISTSKETPKDAVLPSHIYLLRGGFIQQISSGIYNFLPLGKIVLDKIRNIIKEELDAAECQEVQLGFVTPASLWQESGRYEKYGKELLRFEDRKEQNYVLGPTHEEMMVELVKGCVKSYKQLPVNLYQINLKFRDELRPRFGLMRGREFLMKDGYSFHASEEDMMREFNLMEETYRKIFARLGLDFRVVEADSGAIGGSGSKEFMVLADSGEDTICMCESCEYAANIEAARRAPKEAPGGIESKAFEKVATPGKTTIEEIATFFNIDPYYTLRAVVKKALYDDRETIAFFFVRGSDNLQEIKAANSIGANELVDLTDEELKQAGIAAGYIGPYALSQAEVMVFDQELRDAKDLVCGANEEGCHFVGLDMGIFEELTFADLIEVNEADVCAECGGRLIHKKGIEVGHIFQLRTRYSEPLSATFLDENGKAQPFVMGTYGIGVSRLVAAVIEQNHDDKGCVWTEQTAPFRVSVMISNIKDDEQKAFGEELYAVLKEKGIEVVLDDRPERFGAKITDFELLGFPYGVIVGKGLKEGTIELVTREGLEKKSVSKEEIAEKIIGMFA